MSDQQEPSNNFEFAMGLIHRQKQDHGVDIHGKLYSKVQDRIEIFRRVFGGEYGIDTTVDSQYGFDNGAPIVAVAKIEDIATGRIVASGYACEFVGSSKYTRFNPVEVAETSAIGRALAAFGLHGGEYASAEEIEYAQDKESSDRRGNGPLREPSDEEVARGHRTFEQGMAVGQAAAQNRGPDRMNRQSDYQRDTRENVSRETRPQFYVPDTGDPGRFNPEREHSMILDQIDQIDNVNDLGAYWGLVRDFVGTLTRDSQHLAAEIKAAFAAANSTLGGH